MDWTEHKSMFSDAGDIGGDLQAGNSYNRRWYVERPNGERALIDAYTFPAFFDEDDEKDKRRLIGWNIEFMVCTDLDDPGGSEVWAEGTHAIVGEEIETPGIADAAAKLLLEHLDPNMLDWCGAAAHRIDHQYVNAYLRAQSGVLYCDRVFAHGWREKIRARVDIDHDELCVLGQLNTDGTGFEAMLSELELSPEDCERLGFYPSAARGRSSDDADMLNDIWRRLLTPKS